MLTCSGIAHVGQRLVEKWNEDICDLWKGDIKEKGNIHRPLA